MSVAVAVHARGLPKNKPFQLTGVIETTERQVSSFQETKKQSLFI